MTQLYIFMLLTSGKGFILVAFIYEKFELYLEVRAPTKSGFASCLAFVLLLPLIQYVFGQYQVHLLVFCTVIH